MDDLEPFPSLGILARERMAVGQWCFSIIEAVIG
jgi:hypothetical protein